MTKNYLLLAFLIFAFLGCKDNKTPTPIKKENVVEQSAKRVAPELTPPPEKPAPKLTEAQIAENRKDFRYHIIAASYNTQNQAEDFKNRLYQKGYPSIVLETNGKYRVVMQSFSKKESAINELDRLRKLNKKPDLWLLHQ